MITSGDEPVAIVDDESVLPGVTAEDAGLVVGGVGADDDSEPDSAGSGVTSGGVGDGELESDEGSVSSAHATAGAPVIAEPTPSATATAPADSQCDTFGLLDLRCLP